jgi:hypothetical protein
MKFLFLVLVSFNAFACPDLTGDFFCESGEEKSVRRIETHTNGYTIHTDGNEGFFSNDGKIRELPSNDTMTDGKVSGKCEGEKFIVNFSATVLYEGEDIAKQKSETLYTIVGERLHISRKTRMRWMGIWLPLPSKKFVCTRL